MPSRRGFFGHVAVGVGWVAAGCPSPVQTSPPDSTLTNSLTASPIIFDDTAILTPLLHGELYPIIRVKSGRKLSNNQRIDLIKSIRLCWNGRTQINSQTPLNNFPARIE